MTHINDKKKKIGGTDRIRYSVKKYNSTIAKRL